MMNRTAFIVPVGALKGGQAERCVESLLQVDCCPTEVLICCEAEAAAEWSQRYAQDRRVQCVGMLPLAELLGRTDAEQAMLVAPHLGIEPKGLRSLQDYLAAHPDVDAVMGACCTRGEADRIEPLPERVVVANVLVGSGEVTSTMLLRRRAVEGMTDIDATASYALCARLLMQGATVRNVNEAVLWRDAEPEAEGLAERERREMAVRDRLVAWTKRHEEEAKADFEPVPVSGNRLSVIIAFLNEREEVGRTVRSVRATAGDAVDVIVVNDHSDGDYDYEADLAGLQVHYHRNRFPLGASAAKEKGVRMCSTPYFILLDAHMRIYTKDWVAQLVGELDRDDRQVLCCQTRNLRKQPDGEVADHGSLGVYGAFVDFRPTRYVPLMRWNTGYIDHALADGQIPGVLGASYCCSKRYWDVLKGYQGLIQYGGEEEYLSIKAWMEGGGCRLMADVEIGHIYRAKPPYVMNGLAIVYNSMAISHTLYPTSFQAYAKAVALRNGRQIYERLAPYFNAYREELDALRRYYAATFTAHGFDFILRINRLPQPSEGAALQRHEARLKELVDAMAAGADRSKVGLADGLCGVMLACARYAQWSGDAAYDDLASDMLGDVLRGLYREQPATFAGGVCGIGWTLVYLLRHGLLDSDMTEELQYIDRCVMERDVRRVRQRNIKTGLGGTLAYVVARLGMGRSVADTAFDQDFLQDLLRAAREVAATEPGDYRVLSLALQFIACMEQGTWSILPPEVDDVLPLPDTFKEPAADAPHGLEGRAGFVLQLTEWLGKLRRFRKVTPPPAAPPA